jgi:hypothetical protein
MYSKIYMFEQVNNDTIRSIIIERDNDDGSKQVYDIIEFTISPKAKLRSISKFLADRANFDDWEIDGEFDFGKAKLLESKLVKAIEQLVERWKMNIQH